MDKLFLWATLVAESLLRLLQPNARVSNLREPIVSGEDGVQPRGKADAALHREKKTPLQHESRASLDSQLTLGDLSLDDRRSSLEVLRRRFDSRGVLGEDVSADLGVGVP